MPTIHVEMFEGRTAEQKKNLVEKVTQAAVDALGCKPETVDIIITDIRKDNWSTGGKLWSEPR
jgi:4-oxalocrotonate tautomerase